MAYAGGDIEPVEAPVVVEAASPWSFSIAMEGRNRPTQSYGSTIDEPTNQLVTKLGFGYTINDDWSIFGAAWLRHRVQSGDMEPDPITGIWTDKYNDDMINAGDLMIGVYYSLNQYVNPYVFWCDYYDGTGGSKSKKDGDTKFWSGFGAVGIDGTLWSSGKHAFGYYTEYYFGLGDEDGYGTENWAQYGSETALKYTYTIYDHTSLYYQPTWMTGGEHGPSNGYLEHRYGIKVTF